MTDDTVGIGLLHTLHDGILVVGHGEGTTVLWIHPNHAVSDVHGVLILQRCADKQEFRVTESFVRERVGLIRSHNTAQATVGSVEQSCIRSRGVGATMSHRDEGTFRVGEQELTQGLYVCMFCLFNVLTGVCQ